MIIAKQMDVRSNLKHYFDLAYNGEPVIVPRKNNHNVVILSEDEYNRLNQNKRVTQYLSLSANMDKDHDSLSVNKGNVKMHNLEKLNVIKGLSENWNGNGAPPFPESLTDKIAAFLDKLIIQPEIFPTALCTIQLEYDNSRRDHMEIEISDDDTAEVFIVNFDGSELTGTIPSTAEAINERAGAFYG